MVRSLTRNLPLIFVAIVALAALVVAVLPRQSEQDLSLFGAGVKERAYVAGKYALEVDGQFAGWLYAADGGNATADVITEQPRPDRLRKKHLSGVKYTPIVLTMGADMSDAFYQWLQSSVDGNMSRKNGAIVVVDDRSNEKERFSFTNALVTEIGFPAANAASKDASRMTVTLLPERTTRTIAAGGKVGGGYSDKNQKRWLPANFRLRIDGLDEAMMSRVNKVDPITATNKIVMSGSGQSTDAHWVYSDLQFTVPESHADGIWTWARDFIVNGNNGDAQEKGGRLDYLTPNQEILLTVTFDHLGIYDVDEDKLESGGGTTRRVSARLYAEKIGLQPGSGAAAKTK